MIILQPTAEIITPLNTLNVYTHIENCGRTCYQSFDKITTDSAEKMIRMLIKSGHESVLEHFSVTTKILCDVGAYKDLTRHRHASFSIESTRYCAYNKDKFGNEIKFIQPVNIPQNTQEYSIWLNTMQIIENNYMEMAKLNAKPDQLRMLLPHSTAAQVSMTANLREWRHILKLRTHPAAHPTVRQIMIQLLNQFKDKLPAVFADIPDYNL